MKQLLSIGAALLLSTAVNAQNPYLPLWEHIPDGEPYVFDDPDNPGKQRVYIYGSHDNLIHNYCGLDQVVWSASVDDLSSWRYDGVIFKSVIDSMHPDVLFAPDVVEAQENGKKVYYLTPNNQAYGRNGMIGRSDRPDGPFKAVSHKNSLFKFDPAIMQDEDGRVYGYWGFRRSYAAELDPTTMCTLKPGTKIIEDMVSGTEKGQEGIFNFFEASSIRKIKNKYVFIYSRFTKEGEFGLPTSNYNLAYAYGDSPLGPWTYGGTIIDARGRDTDENGTPIATGYISGNTHGSIAEINGKWWVFYHRQTGTDEYSRQAMVAPIDVNITKDGRVMISEGEVTSEGFAINGLNPLSRTAASWACYFTGNKPMGKEYPHFYPTGSYPSVTRPDAQSLNASYSLSQMHAPMINNTDGSTIGYKYFNMNVLAKNDAAEIDMHIKPLGIKGEIVFMLDSPYKSRGGKVIGRLSITGKESQEPLHITSQLSGLKGIKGKHALYMLFNSDTKGASLCDFYDFIIRK